MSQRTRVVAPRCATRAAGREPTETLHDEGAPLFPISDNLPTLRTPLVTYALVAATVAVWLLYQRAGFSDFHLAASVCDLGMVPAELTHRRPVGFAIPIGPGMACVIDDMRINILTPITSMFLHGGWMHLLSNMAFLWVFGNNVEDSMGHVRFLLFYLVCGLGAAAAHIALDPASPVPTVGASGAISGVLGAYLILYPRARVNVLFFFILIFIRPLPAWIMLGYWFVLQVISGLPQLLSVRPEVSGGVAVWAHVGGFVAGVLLIKLFARRDLVEAHLRMHGDVHRYRWRR